MMTAEELNAHIADGSVGEVIRVAEAKQVKYLSRIADKVVVRRKMHRRRAAVHPELGADALGGRRLPRGGRARHEDKPQTLLRRDLVRNPREVLDLPGLGDPDDLVD